MMGMRDELIGEWIMRNDGGEQDRTGRLEGRWNLSPRSDEEEERGSLMFDVTIPWITVDYRGLQLVTVDYYSRFQ